MRNRCIESRAFDTPTLAGLPFSQFMKVWSAITLAALGFSLLHAQEAAPTGQPRQEIFVDTPRPPKTAEVNTNALSTPKPPQKDAKPPVVTYSGLGPEVAKATNKWKVFSLRRPANPKEDGSNLIRETRTEAARPIKLLSIDF